MTRLGDGPYIEIPILTADGNTNWDWFLYAGYIFGAGAYVNGSFSTNAFGTAAQLSARWWWRDFGEGGLWDVRVIHTVGFDVGIYSFRLDDREFARLDGWVPGGDVNNLEVTVASGLRIPPGRHKLSIVMVGANAGSTGLKFYPAISGLFLRRTARLPELQVGRRMILPEPRGTQVIDIQPWAATGNTNWDLVQPGTTQMAYAYELYSTGAQNAARWWDVDLTAGLWDVDVMCATAPSAGIINVQIDGVTVGTIDTYSAVTAFGVRKIARITVLSSGRHRLSFLMATKHASSSGYLGDISAVQLRQAFPGPRAKTRIVNLTLWWAHGDVNWSTFFLDAGMLYSGDVESSGAQNAARWWYLDLPDGTWDLSVLHSTGSNRGIYSIRIDDQQVATLDGYGAPQFNVRSTITGIVVRGSGSHKFGFVMASKNASSSAYYGTVTAVQLRRTG